MAKGIKGNAISPLAGAAKVKRAQPKSKGLTQARGGASNHVESNGRGSKVGLIQKGVAAKIAAPAKRKPNKLAKKPISAQPKGPKNLKNNLVLHNSVAKSDVARLRKAHSLSVPAGAISGSGNFGKFIGK